MARMKTTVPSGAALTIDRHPRCMRYLILTFRCNSHSKRLLEIAGGLLAKPSTGRTITIQLTSIRAKGTTTLLLSTSPASAICFYIISL